MPEAPDRGAIAFSVRDYPTDRSTRHMTDDQLKDWELGLLVNARTHDDPRVVESEAAEAYRDYRDIIDDAQDLDTPTVVEATQAQRLEDADGLLEASSGMDEWELVNPEEREAELEALSAVSDILSDALKEHNDLRDGVVEAMSVPSMVEQFRDEDDDVDLSVLAQNPSTGGDPGDDTDDTDPDTSDLSAEERNEVKDKLRRADLMAGRTDDHAERLRQEAASIVGVDDAEDIDMEVL